ncbi:MAG: hypothetical protein OXH34_01805 [Bacteroidetes bacterium]|nr:hypothetical protein [Bacteroidota bacterium]
MGVPVRYKKDWLCEQVRTCLMTYQADVARVWSPKTPVLHIEKEVMDWRFNWFQSRDLRVEVMGDPVWYCEILFSGPTIPTKETVDGQWRGGMHEFSMALFLQYKERMSTDLFEDMTDEQSHNRQGLMLYLRNQGIQRIFFPDPNTQDEDMTFGDVLMSIRVTGDEEVYLDQRSIVNFENEEFGGNITNDPNESNRAHLLTFRVDITDAV